MGTRPKASLGGKRRGGGFDFPWLGHMVCEFSSTKEDYK